MTTCLNILSIVLSIRSKNDISPSFQLLKINAEEQALKMFKQTL